MMFKERAKKAAQYIMKSKTEQEDAREFVETTEQKDQQELPAVIDAELEIL